jgi:hypothetical protein
MVSGALSKMAGRLAVHSMKPLQRPKPMSDEENSQSPDKPPKDKGPTRARRRLGPRKSCTGKEKAETPPPAETGVTLPLEVVLNPGHLLKMAIDHEFSSADIETDNSTLAVLKDMVEGMQAGSSLDDLRVPLLQLTGNQEERAKLVRSLMLSNDYSRLSKYLIIRDKLEQFMLQQATLGNLSPAEGLSFLRTVREEIENIQRAVTEGAAAGADVTTLLNKVTFATKAQEDLLAKKIKGSPQNRELVRKLIYQLAKITRRGKSATN